LIGKLKTDKPMKILITGGAGFIGSNFIRYLFKQHPNYQVTNLDLLTYAGRLENLKDIEKDLRYKFVKGDIAEKELVEKLITEEKPDFLINFAAASHVDRSISEPEIFVKTNVLGTQVLLEAARIYGLKKFLFVSTDEADG